MVKIAVLIVLFLAVTFGAALLAAQFAVWGLAMFHVNSGIWGPYFLLASLGMTIGVSGAASASGKK